MPSPNSPLPPGYRLDRRDLLRLAAAGAIGLVAPGCPSKRASVLIPDAGIAGKIHGQDDVFAHKVRSGELFKRAPSATREVEVLIVGAGAAGLTAAWRLRHADVPVGDVLLVDAGRAAGGNSRGGENEVSAYPWGAHYLRVPTAEHRSLERFMEEVGLITGRDPAGRPDWDTNAVCPAPHERLFEDGIWRESLFPPPRSGDKADQAEFEKFQTLVEALGKRRDAQGRRAFAIPVDLSSQDPDLLALDNETFAAWFERHGFKSAGLRWLLDYSCRDDYGTTIEETSAWAGLHYFCARRSPDGTREAILTWPEGNAKLVELLLTHSGAPRVETRSLCVQLQPGATPSDPSEAVVYHGERDELVRYKARHVVWAAPQFVLGRVLKNAAYDPAWTYGPWLVVNITLTESPGGAGFQLAWDNVFYNKPSLGYVVANRGTRWNRPSQITWYRPFTGDPKKARETLFEQSYADLKQMALAELLEVHPPLKGKVKSVDVWRWGHAMIRPTPGFIWGARRKALERDDALLCAHTDLSGISIFEEAFYRGVVAGEAVLRRRGTAFKTML